MKRLFLASQLAASIIAAVALTPAADAANPLGPRPHCAHGMIAKVENNMWVCRPLTYSAPQQSDPTAQGLPQKPHCRIGLVAVFENGNWFCKELAITQDPGRNPTANQSQKPTCAPGKLPKMENGHWVCKTPDITSKPNTEATLLLPAIQKVREAAAK